MNRCDRSFVVLIAMFAAGRPWLLPCSFADDRQKSASPAQGGKEISSKSTAMRLVLIPAGAFEMGSNRLEEGHSRNESPHIVHISRSFYMGIAEVTQREYESVMDTNPSVFSSTGTAAPKLIGADTNRFPVENVSWFDAIEFCNKLSDKDDLKPYYSLTGVEREDGSIKSAVVAVVAGGDGYRLPTEAEWEYACRARTTTTYYTGNSVGSLSHAGWCAGQTDAGAGEKHSHRVCRKTPNAFGLFDMHGNVSEWCQDWYDYNYYDHSPAKDPTGAAGGSLRVMRGGGWNDEALLCRSAHRSSQPPMRRDDGAGFRVVLTSVLPALPKKKPGVPPFRIVVDRRDGRTLDVFNQETYDSLESARQRLGSAKLVGNLGTIRIVDANGNNAE